jgi:pilus assembly protein Flp/PilA
MRAFARRFLEDEGGATALEYAMIGAMVGLVLVGALGIIGTSLKNTFDNVSGNINP